jgi:FtsZ-interacting cell division protein ZipA
MPIADEVDRRVKELTTLRDNLDTGFSLLVFPRSGAFLERDIWVQATRLGLEFRSDDGLFHWGEVGYPPLFTLSSLTKDEFSLAAVQTNTLHQGLQLGFSLPRCPAPSQSFLGVCSAAEELARQLNGLVLDDAQRVFDQPSRSAAERNIAMASATLTQAGLAPGSTEAIRIWQDCLQLGSCHQLPKEQMP